MKKIIGTIALITLLSLTVNAQQEEPKKAKKVVAKTEKAVAKAEKKECSKDEKKGASCCAHKAEAK